VRQNRVGTKRALLVTEYYPPAPGPATARIGAFARFLPEFGWTPIVITPSEARTVGLGPAAVGAEQVRSDLTRVISTGEVNGAGIYPVSPRLPASVARVIDTLYLASRVLPPVLRPPLPEAWTVDWLGGAFLAILDAARREGAGVIYATAPPVTGLFAAALAARRLDMPLILDFRDLWCDNPGYAAPPATAGLHRRCERWLLRQASRVVVNTPSARRLLGKRYAAVPAIDSKLCVIPNGFDPNDFRVGNAECEVRNRENDGSGVVGPPHFAVHGGAEGAGRVLARVLAGRGWPASGGGGAGGVGPGPGTGPGPHSAFRTQEVPFRLRFVGKLYGEFGRTFWDAELARRRGLSGWRAPWSGELLPPGLACLNPVGVIEATRDLLDGGALAPGELLIEFIGHYGAGNERLARELGLGGVIEFRSTIHAEAALAAIRSADALLLISANAEHVIPAKTYEYMAAGKPLLVVANPGDLERLLHTSDVTWFGARLDDRASIRAGMARLLQFLRSGARARSADPKCLARYERRRQAGTLARIFEEVVP
jgi:glycosyltransferase involved in cell wall biosynthesis